MGGDSTMLESRSAYNSQEPIPHDHDHSDDDMEDDSEDSRQFNTIQNKNVKFKKERRKLKNNYMSGSQQ
jgi:hypothetical protein